jgi:ornithine cyclodeaminase/alanine dehydrogenase-like protein (mu-crystallin family)
MRILFAADHAHEFAQRKPTTPSEASARRYPVSLFDLNTGALAALIDGRHTTDFRTGGASGVVARRMAFDGDDAAKVARLG